MHRGSKSVVTLGRVGTFTQCECEVPGHQGKNTERSPHPLVLRCYSAVTGAVSNTISSRTSHITSSIYESIKFGRLD